MLMWLSTETTHTMAKSFAGEVSEQICAHKPQMVLGVSLAVVLILLSFVSFTVVSPSSPTYVIVVLNIATLVCVVVVLLTAITACTRRGY